MAFKFPFDKCWFAWSDRDVHSGECFQHAKMAIVQNKDKNVLHAHP